LARCSAPADQHEVADQRAHVHQVLDAADQVLQCRMILVYHRPAVVGRVADQQVDQVALHRNVAGEVGGFAFLFAAAWLAQRFAAFDDVAHHRVEMGADFR
jgi:hypothetical protein